MVNLFNLSITTIMYTKEFNIDKNVRILKAIILNSQLSPSLRILSIDIFFSSLNNKCAIELSKYINFINIKVKFFTN